jgi:hypothetical protein
VPLPPRIELKPPTLNTALASETQVEAEGPISRRKRSREELEKELNDWIREESTLRVKRQRLPRVSRLSRKKESMENIGLETTDLTGEENISL